MKTVYALVPLVLTSTFGLLALAPSSNYRSVSNQSCAHAIRGSLISPSSYSETAIAYGQGGETWGRDEMMLEVANELDRLTPAEADQLRSKEPTVREKLARDRTPKFAALLPSDGAHFGFALSEIHFDGENQSGAVVGHVAYCKFLVADGVGAHEPFSVVIDGERH
jgi:hypothetical protein